MDIKIIDGDNSFLRDKDGTIYINFSESINILGHRNPEIIELILSHLNSGIIHYPLTISKPEIANIVAEKLIKIAGMESAGYVFTSSGSEAADVAMSIMRQHGPVIIISGSYQGNSGQSVFMNSDNVRRFGRDFCIDFPYNGDIKPAAELMKYGVSGIIIEPLQVEGGLRELPLNFVVELKEKFPELLICFDEAYTGIGKTGDFFAYEKYGIKPDLLIIGKAIGGGLPLGITLVSKNVYTNSNVYKMFRNNAYGSTSGNLISLDIASLIIDKVSSLKFLSMVRNKGEIIYDMLYPVYGNRLTGRGLIWGIIPKKGDIAENLAEKLREQGLMITTMSGVIRISPPLTIDVPILKKGCALIIENVR